MGEGREGGKNARRVGGRRDTVSASDNCLNDLKQINNIKESIKISRTRNSYLIERRKTQQTFD